MMCLHLTGTFELVASFSLTAIFCEHTRFAPKNFKEKLSMNQTKQLTETMDWNTIPTEVTDTQFEEFFLPCLSLPKRGPKGKIPLVEIFNAILYVL